MKWKYGVVLGAVLITLLMISSSTAVGSTTHIQPNVKIGKNKLTTLEKSLQYIDNTDVKTLVQAIINEIKRDGVATSKDIEQIENNLGIFFPIYVGRIRSEGSGVVMPTIPGLLIFGSLCCYFGPSIAVKLDADNGKTYINLIERYDGNHGGYAIGVPWVSCGCDPFHHDGPIYGMRGTATLIIMTYGTPV
jgi:hypothetical protein